MRRLLPAFAALALLLGSASALLAAARPAAWTPPPARSASTAVDDDPDMPASLANGMDKAAYLQLRSNYFGQRADAPFDVAFAARLDAIAQLQKQNSNLGAFAASGFWTPIGPYPIPNGQTTTLSTPVSGRVTAIVVHPANANIAYVGTAQGGVYRTLDGGATWTALTDAAASLAIGALALAPSNPSILYVGTGEANLSGDSFFGVGLYRIDNADTAPVLNGPFNPTPTTDVIGAKTFTGRTISQILVNPTNPDIIFVSTASGIGGASGEALGASPPITALRGIYRSTNATSGSPSFAKLTVNTLGSIAPDVTGNRIINDMIYDPTDATGNTILCWVFGNAVAGDGGVWRTTNALAATPTFAQTFVTTANSSRGTFAATRVAGVTTIIVGTGELATGTSCTTGSGALRRSTDGGVTWSVKLAGGGGYCGGQCFYDLPVAISPTDPNLILIGGAGNGTCSRVFARSTNGAATFTVAGGADVGLHADAHAIAFAPSDPNTVYEGNDGGIFKSVNGGASWTSVNTAGFSATQFTDLATHPIDPNFTIGGTQDNGTNWYTPGATWNRIDFGDGGFAAIDQNAANTTSVIMYHTYFNQQNNLVGYAEVTNTANAFDGNWFFFGQNSNGIATTELPNFYAPLVVGPGTPNTVYYGTDRLHRSSDQGANNPVVSQAPIAAGVPISAIAISPQSDNVRLVGLNNGQIWGTITGSSTLVNFTGGGMPAKFVGRIAIDPSNANVAVVAFCGFGLAPGAHVWKTSNLLSGTPTWTASGTGIPDVPVNALAIDPALPTRMWAGTDVGVYVSFDGGGTWAPFTTGMPVVAVFGISYQAPAGLLRIATHGRGMWERQIDQPVATQLALVGAEIVGGHPRMTWFSADGANQQMNLYRRAIPGDFQLVGPIQADGTGQLTYTDVDAVAGRSYEYQIGIVDGSTERRLGQVWVDVPVNAAFGVRRAPDAGRSLQFTVSLSSTSAARLELVDVSGRRIAGRDLGSIGLGEHTVAIDAAVGPGIYWARLLQAGKMAATRVAVVR